LLLAGIQINQGDLGHEQSHGLFDQQLSANAWRKLAWDLATDLLPFFFREAGLGLGVDV
jgi:hypothetical protein